MYAMGENWYCVKSQSAAGKTDAAVEEVVSDCSEELLKRTTKKFIDFVPLC